MDEAMQKLLEIGTKILEQQKETNTYLENLAYKQCTGKDPYEMLTREQAMKEFPIGNTNTSLKVFNDPELPVQRYTKAHRVQRKALIDYLGKHHNYLSDGD